MTDGFRDPLVVVEMTRGDLNDMLAEAAERGAVLALDRLGLHDENAVHDLRELRDLVTAWRDIRRDVRQSVTKSVTTAVLLLILLGVTAWATGLLPAKMP
jgi:hypothetical protein